ncbi:MAG: transaldolase family protein [Candidatus Zipacnadales bacterium]
MKIFFDTADLNEIRTLMAWGICDGVTTNPSINLKCGVTTWDQMRERTIEIANLIAPRPLSVEVVADDPEEMLRQAREYVLWAPNVAVKITITTTTGESCLPVIHTLYSEGVDVNVTAMMTVNQLMLAAKAGGKYLSLFGGRIDDEGNDAVEVIRSSREWLDRNAAECPNHPEIIVGSTRTTKNIQEWALAGAHILTITPEILNKMLVNARTKETVTQFLNDGRKALESIHRD